MNRIISTALFPFVCAFWLFAWLCFVAVACFQNHEQTNEDEIE